MGFLLSAPLFLSSGRTFTFEKRSFRKDICLSDEKKERGGAQAKVY